MVACDGTLNPCLYAGQYSEFLRFSWAFACRRQLPIVKLDERPYDVLPLSGLTKRRVRALAPSLGAEDRLVMKVPTADLELLTLQRPDEDSYGISYKNIDDFLEGKEVTAEITSNIKCFYEATWQKRSLPVAILPDGN